MKRRTVRTRRAERCQLRLTAMIDVVFLLLVFFVLTLRIIPPEGDLAMKMPRVGQPEMHSPPCLPIRVQIGADAEGEPASIQFGDRRVAGFDELSQEMRSIAGYVREATATADQPVVELVCDEQLRYRYAVAAISAVRGYRDREGNLVRITERIRFLPPQ